MIDTRWLRIKRFNGPVRLIVSVGSQEGPRLNLSIHRTPAKSRERP